MNSLAPRNERRIVRVAHRYGNDLEALARALSRGVEMVEADVWFADKNVWVRHEYRIPCTPLLVDRRRGGSVPLDAFCFGGYFARLEREPLDLASLLRATDNRCSLLVDAKGSYGEAGVAGFAASLATLLPAHRDRGQLEICGQNWRILDRLRKIAPWLTLRYSAETVAQWEALQRLVVCGAVHRLSVQWGLFDADAARYCSERELDVYVWTIDDTATARRILAAGASGIISNDLDLLDGLAHVLTSPGTGRHRP